MSTIKEQLKSSKQTPISWWEAWLTALTEPNIENYESIAKNPDITEERVYLWIFLIGIITTLIIMAKSILLDRSTELFPELFSVMCVLLGFVPLTVVIFFWITIAIPNAIAKRLGGAGEVEELIRIVAAIFCPMTIINFITYEFSGGPTVAIASLGLNVYRAGLTVLSVKAVYRISWGKAAISTIPALMANWAIYYFLRSV
jgi:hypothetical protein